MIITGIIFTAIFSFFIGYWIGYDASERSYYRKELQRLDEERRRLIASLSFKPKK